MSTAGKLSIWAVVLMLVGAAGAKPPQAPRKAPHIGYLFPAGGQRGSSFQVKIGGEDIYGAAQVVVSGSGVNVRILNAVDPDVDMDIFKKAQKKRMKGASISETVTVEVAIAAEAQTGLRDLFVQGPGGVSNKLSFQVGELLEITETEPNDDAKNARLLKSLPVTINGQILPGDQDWYRFSARKGEHLVAEVSARVLVPYIADAVPGWFQATLSLQDEKGIEVARADSFRFRQDPVLFYDVPADGLYTLIIRDSIYRGRPDFVYRLRLGEIPYITDIFPLGTTRSGDPLDVEVLGRNLPGDSATLRVDRTECGSRSLSVRRKGITSNIVPFEVVEGPEVFSNQRETSPRRPMKLTAHPVFA